MTRTYSLGRFSFELPNTYLETGSSQSIYTANVHTEALVKSPDEHLKLRMQSIQAESTEAITFSEQDIGLADALTVAYVDDPDDNPGLVTFLSQKPYQEELLFSKSARKSR